jgi:O-antigen/teichoic acid export membrane protein
MQSITSRIQIIYKNNTNIIANIVGSFVVKGGAMVVTVITTPAYIRYFDNNIALGVWFTILALLQCVIQFDLGIGNGLRNKLTEEIAKNNNLETKKYISSAYCILGFGAICASLCFAIISKYINWNNILNVNENAISGEYLKLCLQIVFSGVMIQLVLKLINSILYALQKSSLVNFLSLFSSIIILIVVTTCPNLGAERNLKVLSLVNILAVNLPLLVATVFVFCTSLKGARPQFKMFRKSYAQSIWGVGILFFVLQTMIILITSANEFFITKLCSPKLTVDYQIYNKMFNMISSVFSLALIPIWSAVTKAQAENNMKWILKLHNVLLFCASVVIVFELLMVPFMQFIVNIWLGNESIVISYEVALIFAIANGVLLWHSVNCQIANGMGYLKPQLIFLTIGAISKIPLSILLVNLSNWWVGIILSNIIALLPLSIIQPIWLKKEIIRRHNVLNNSC